VRPGYCKRSGDLQSSMLFSSFYFVCFVLFCFVLFCFVLLLFCSLLFYYVFFCFVQCNVVYFTELLSGGSRGFCLLEVVQQKPLG
jgi:hypothetical protein